VRTRAAAVCLALALLAACGDARPTLPALESPAIFGMWDLETVNGRALPAGIAPILSADSAKVLSGDLEFLATGSFRQHLEIDLARGGQTQHVGSFGIGSWAAGGDHLTLRFLGVPATANVSDGGTVMTYTLDGDLYSYHKR